MNRFQRTCLGALLIGLTACSHAASPTSQAAPVSTAAEAISSPTAGATATDMATATISPNPGETPTAQPLSNDSIETQVNKLAAWYLEQDNNSALGVAVVVRNPQTGVLDEEQFNYGTTARGGGEAVTSSTVYEIGSITKLFTGILLAQAVLAGDVKLDDRIQKYLPDGIRAPAYKNKPITLLDLATHRSGLPRDPATDDIGALYQWLNGYRLPRAPGAEYSYSNLGYALLGDMLARQAGTDFDALEFQSVSQPLGLPDTREALNQGQTGRLAHGYTYGGSPAGNFPQSGALSSAGYMHSTLDDMTRFLLENMEPETTPLAGPINLAQSLQAEGRDARTGAALGWDIDALGTTDERLSKVGATYGFTSYISLRRDGRYGFVLLSNGMYVEGLVSQMLHILNGE